MAAAGEARWVADRGGASAVVASDRRGSRSQHRGEECRIPGVQRSGPWAQVGAIALTVTPWGDHSRARTRVSPMTAALLAE